jgi:hypothetical protein
MYDNQKKDVYYELYKEAKFTSDELKQFPECQNLPEEDIERLSDLLFDLGILAQKIIFENNE